MLSFKNFHIDNWLQEADQHLETFASAECMKNALSKLSAKYL
jgi:hypothetical protein